MAKGNSRQKSVGVMLGLGVRVTRASIKKLGEEEERYGKV